MTPDPAAPPASAPSGLRSWWKPALLSLLVTLGGLEGIARLRGAVDLRHPRDSLTDMFQPDPDTFWALRPGYYQDNPAPMDRWGNEPLSINSLGLRGAEVPLARPPGVRRVVVLGGSHPMGMWVRADERYSSVLERLLNEREPGRWQVINAAVAGYTSWQGVLQMRTKVARFAPDIVVSDLGHNDSLPRVPWGLPRADAALREPPAPVRGLLHLLHTRSAAYRWALQRVTQVANQDGGVRVTKEEHDRNVREIGRLAESGGAKTLYFNQWMANVTAPGVSNNYGPLCLFPEANLEPVVDVCGVFAGRDDLPSLFADALHANATGHAMIARAAFDKFVALGWVQ